jgi:hypothetical protein
MKKTDLLRKCIDMFDEKIKNLTDDIATLQTRLDTLKKCRSEILYDFSEALTQEYLDETNTMYAEEPDELTYWDGDESDRMQH